MTLSIRTDPNKPSHEVFSLRITQQTGSFSHFHKIFLQAYRGQALADICKGPGETSFKWKQHFMVSEIQAHAWQSNEKTFYCCVWWKHTVKEWCMQYEHHLRFWMCSFTISQFLGWDRHWICIIACRLFLHYPAFCTAPVRRGCGRILRGKHI